MCSEGDLKCLFHKYFTDALGGIGEKIFGMLTNKWHNQREEHSLALNV